MQHFFPKTNIPYLTLYTTRSSLVTWWGMKNEKKDPQIKIHTFVSKETILTNKQVHRFKNSLRFNISLLFWETMFWLSSLPLPRRWKETRKLAEEQRRWHARLGVLCRWLFLRALRHWRRASWPRYPYCSSHEGGYGRVPWGEALDRLGEETQKEKGKWASVMK